MGKISGVYIKEELARRARLIQRPSDQNAENVNSCKGLVVDLRENRRKGYKGKSWTRMEPRGAEASDTLSL
jgi:hypothetical protein